MTKIPDVLKQNGIEVPENLEGKIEIHFEETYDLQKCEAIIL